MPVFVAGSWDEWEFIQANKIEHRDLSACDGCGCIMSRCRCPSIIDSEGKWKRIPLKSTEIVMGKNGHLIRVYRGKEV